MESALAGVVITVAIVAVLIAIGGAFLRREHPYESIGKGRFALDTPDVQPEPPPESAEGRAIAREEIRQMVEARSARLEARGEAPLDVEAEVDRQLRDLGA